MHKNPGNLPVLVGVIFLGTKDVFILGSFREKTVAKTLENVIIASHFQILLYQEFSQ
jgi:hypothetical protein